MAKYIKRLGNNQTVLLCRGISILYEVGHCDVDSVEKSIKIEGRKIDRGGRVEYWVICVANESGSGVYVDVSL